MGDTPDPARPSVKPPSAAERRELLRRANPLKAKFTVGRRGLTDAVIEEIRRMFQHTDLLKMRVDAQDADETELVAMEVAERVPCVLLQRLGRVALLYHPLSKDRPGQ